eukprot:CAMPEP_0184690918 /NCGR_PEP_ID=MMETSP0312-20130426/31509_1 /TAXON_ID=31354 /ORGANISM="Compsopogon coeruleus, Strain SAG 36.94" /LENGTH=46 /DNA_ID= /DNA_START= /DNA_END= /DNA_ORIENTATION=
MVAGYYHMESTTGVQLDEGISHGDLQCATCIIDQGFQPAFLERRTG